MSGMLVLLLAIAQEDPLDRQVSRLKDQLRLTDEQAGKAREMLKRQQDDLKSILTDEQKPRYDEMLRGGGGRGGNNAQGGPGGARGGWFPSSDDLKARVGLSDEQVSKVNEIRDSIREEMRKMFQDRNNRPGPEAFEKIREDSTKKIRELLNDEQKAKFDEVLKSVPTPGAPGGDRGGRGGGNIDDRVARAMEVLKFEKPEEADAVKGLVRKVIELQEKAELAQRENRTKLEELQRDAALSDEAVGDKLGEMRKGSKELEKQLADARAALSDVLSARQEVDLMRRGVLR